MTSQDLPPARLCEAVALPCPRRAAKNLQILYRVSAALLSGRAVSAMVFTLTFSCVVGILTMRGKVLCSAAFAVASFAFLPGPANAHGDVVTVAEAYAPGTIVVKTQERQLYLMIGAGEAIRYPVGVGRAGMQWSGKSFINAKYVSPAWEAPPDIRRENPKLPPVIPGGSPHNPMGVAAMTLAGTDYAIHGTNQPQLIGHFVSHGCIRMLNADVTDLFGRVAVGTPVVVQ
jgi:lipoprotein-anchoring transpeptidase ErfK/SrfK